MRRHTLIALVTFAVIAAIPPTSRAAEIFSTPDSVTLRTLFVMDATNALEVFLRGIRQPVLTGEGHSDDRFTPEELCEHAAYRAGIEAADGSIAGALVN